MLFDFHCKETAALFETGIVQQTAFWSAVKENLGLETLAVNFKSNWDILRHKGLPKNAVQSDLLMVIQRLDNNNSIVYLPYGPELEPIAEEQGVFMEEMSECLKSFVPKDCIMIRYDLCWESIWADDVSFFDENGRWMGPPENRTQEMRLNYNTRYYNLHKSFTNILPSNTLFLNLRNDKEALLSQMKAKTRYNIGLAERKGVRVRIAGMHELGVWYELYRQTASRNGLYLHPIEYFDAVLKAKMGSTSDGAEVVLLIAELEKIPLAAMFLVLTGGRASYLYGASSSYHKEYMGSYALQWEAIQYAKEHSCWQYDMFGVSPCEDPSHPMYGLYRFKSGFGGQLFHSMGCWDYPLDAKKYACFSSLELQGPGYRVR